MANPPDQKFRAPGEPSVGPPTSGTLEEFKATLDKLHDAQKTKGKAKREKTYVERVDRQLAMLEQFKRAQRYLSLRSSESAATSGPMQPIDPSLPTSFAFDQSVVFVSVDVESYEKAHHKITEIGVATLDTRDLVGVAPGADGKDWQKIIKARHFRIKEHKHLVNHEFVAGHPEGFDFGDTTFVSLEEAPAYVAACFKQPFGVHTTNTPVETVKSMIDELDFNEKRRIILLGHDTLSDIHYLQQLGFDPLKVDNILEPLDTAKIYQAWRREQNPTNLGRIMANFGVAAWKLHNAGNDAVYTVRTRPMSLRQFADMSRSGPCSPHVFGKPRSAAHRSLRLCAQRPWPTGKLLLRRRRRSESSRMRTAGARLRTRPTEVTQSR